jgi:hypothetical protein
MKNEATLVELSGALADAAESAGRSVVRVEGRARPVSGTLLSAEGHVVAIGARWSATTPLGLVDGARFAPRSWAATPGRTSR